MDRWMDGWMDGRMAYSEYQRVPVTKANIRRRHAKGGEAATETH